MQQSCLLQQLGSTPVFGAQNTRRRVHSICTSASVDRTSSCKAGIGKAAGAALLSAVMLSTSFVAPPSIMMPPAQAIDEANMSASERRRNIMERRKELLAQAREKALAAGGEQPAVELPPLFPGVEPEQPQIPSASSDAPTQPLPSVPAPSLPKSEMPSIPKFSLPNKAVEPPPGPRMNIPQEVPKTESPAIPVPSPSARAPQAFSAPPPGPRMN
eukprot:CAMPEP_0206138600 /NCGR_PEP_ID=MMETSP1473-20131121/3434_1 /ASSEMBLY_ACC=CAM_ASM_001109 /TAXON_ID=1461547 /ORGANISM="Stichococcus sp, Strain RCC1054" /LENGTH=214 /DNA_ID=CAMNT_0053532077 /DNA_START=24 /DNA_END=665 /DNA_ORIENTATION=-